MIRKTALLTGIAGLMLTAAPAFAQDAATPPAPTQTPPQAAAPAQPGTLSIQPGSDVKGSDGAVLGKLEGVQNNAAGEQELTVRGADGKLKGVPLGGLKQEGTGIAVAWTLTDYEAAPVIAETAKPDAAPAAEPAPEPATPPAR
ncbi:hypothetical protein BH09PSE1_BH09PSE1_17520 [soil metagenome]